MALLFEGITWDSEVMNTFYITLTTGYWSSSLAPYVVRYNNVWEQAWGYPPAYQSNLVYLWRVQYGGVNLNYSGGPGAYFNVRAMRYF
jgi:hypothetical protein